MKNSTNINIPKKYRYQLDEVYKDSEGYWAYSKKGYYFKAMGNHTAHENSQTELLKVIRTLKYCGCDDCLS